MNIAKSGADLKHSIELNVHRHLFTNILERQCSVINSVSPRRVSHGIAVQRRYSHQATATSTSVTSRVNFKVLNGDVDVNSANYRQNVEQNSKLAARYVEVLGVSTAGGGAKAIERHSKKNKKLLVEDRLRLIFDEGECTLEVSPLAGIGMKYGDVPRGGLITGMRFDLKFTCC